MMEPSANGLITKWRRIWMRMARARPGQGMVEFALVLPLLLLVLFGLIELGRLLVIYSSAFSASREAARYASATGISEHDDLPYYLDVDGINAAAYRVSALAVPHDVDVCWDNGLNEPGDDWCFDVNGLPPRSEIQNRDRVLITVTTRYNPMLGLTPLRPIDIQSSTTRTIIKEVSIQPGAGGGGGGGNHAPSVEIVAPADGSTFTEGVEIQFTCDASDPDSQPVTLEWTSSLDGSIAGNQTSFTTASLSVGFHTITCRGVDPQNLSDSDSIGIHVVPNTPPVVTISLDPGSGPYLQGDPIAAHGIADDWEDGDISGSIVWFVDGALAGASGSTIDLSTLSVGELHTVSAQVTDSGGLVASSNTLTFMIDNSPPVVTILEPENGAMVTLGQSVSLHGTAIDAGDGDLSNGIVWVSLVGAESIFIGSGASLSTADLGVGDHTITAAAQDSHGAIGTASVTIRVLNPEIPLVMITSPANGAEFDINQTISFQAVAIDPTTRDRLSGEWTWIYDRYHEFGSGSNFTYASLPPGSHRIIARFSSYTMEPVGWDEIAITINNQAPTVEIVTPGDGAFFKEGQPVHLSGIATDPESGDLGNQIEWSSNLFGDIGTGSSITTTLLGVGTHTITAEVSDLYLSNSDTVSVTVLPCPTSGATSLTRNNNQDVIGIQWTLNIPAAATLNQPLAMSSISLNLSMNTDPDASLQSITVGSTRTNNPPLAGRLYIVNNPWNGVYPQSATTLIVSYNFRTNKDTVAPGSGAIGLAATFVGCRPISADVTP